MTDLIERQAAIDAIESAFDRETILNRFVRKIAISAVRLLPSAQPEIIRCKDCEYGEQDEVGRWFCRSLGCQIGNEDGSGYCADAERRTDEQTLVRKLSNQPAGGD